MLGAVSYNAVMDSSGTDDWLTVPQAAALSGYHIVHVRRLLLAGTIMGRKWGRDWQVSRASLVGYVQAKEHEGKKRGPKTRVDKV